MHALWGKPEQHTPTMEIGITKRFSMVGVAYLAIEHIHSTPWVGTIVLHSDSFSM